MSRNGSGTYSLSDTLANSTTADADEVNAIFTDIAAEITNSVAVDGQSTMTGPLKASNGSAAAPAYTFGSDTNTGFYRISADKIGLAVNGTLLLTFDSNGATLASGDFIGDVTGAWSYLPSGTKMLFVQTAAPTGWTKDTTHNNKALRVVSGAASSGGTVAFTTAFSSQAVSGTVGDTTLDISQIPAHTHTTLRAGTINSAAGSDNGIFPNVWYNNTTSVASGSAGGGGSHTHTFTGTAIDLEVQYLDVIVATKD